MKRTIKLQYGCGTVYCECTVTRDSAGAWTLTDPAGTTTKADRILTGADITRLIESEEAIRGVQ